MNHNEQKRKIAHAICQKILELGSPNVKACVLYGSVILGHAKKESDIDLMLLLDYTEMSLLQKIKAICTQFQNETKQEIALSFDTVSNFLNNMMEGHQMYINMCLKGQCLLDSLVFKGLQNIINNSPIPSKETVIDSRKAYIQKQTSIFLGRSMTEFVAMVDAIVRSYIHFKEYQDAQISTWTSYESLINHQDIFPLIEIHLSDYRETLMAFYDSKSVYSKLHLPEINDISSLDFKSLIACIDYIQRNTA